MPANGSPTPTLAQTMGGAVGIAEASLPVAVYVLAYGVLRQDTTTATVLAVVVAALLALMRLARRESPRRVISGLVAVAFAAFIVSRTGRAEDFFLPGLLANAVYAAVFVVSVLAGRPLVGELAGRLTGERNWRSNPERVRAFTTATWLWSAVFVLRLLVQMPLYLAGSVLALGVARTAMGLPLFALALWWTYRICRQPTHGGSPG